MRAVGSANRLKTNAEILTMERFTKPKALALMAALRHALHRVADILALAQTPAAEIH